ncbi:hypothetical protein Javan174_0032 [Streptococcus phage Javan174]|uniref:hypothetical protein n=1 Tax=Streptococcus entericus TaxID=155680 RepID=UPI0003623777|nr:hypothetical protein [Streptococcus entericus]QBX24098.1 hypothetical protein Javan174_0032 [Streptococcus phage Javan174]
MNDFDYMEQLLKRYRAEAEKPLGYGNGYRSPTRVKRLGIELRKAMIAFEQKNFL